MRQNFNKLKTTINKPIFMKYFFNTSYVIFEKVLRMILWIFIFTWMAKYLGPHNFGIFSYVESIISVLIIFSTLGLDNIVIKELVKDENLLNKLLGTTFILKSISSIFLIIGVLIYINIVNNEYPMNILILIISISILFQSFNVIDFYFQSKVLSKYVVFTKIIALIVSSLIKIYLIIFEFPLIYFAGVILLDSILIALGLIYFYTYKKLSIFHWKFDMKLAKKILIDSYPLIFAGVIATIYAKVDQIMIREILDVTQSGYYSAAVRLSEIWFIIAGLICSSLFPIIIKTKEKSEIIYYKNIQKLFVYLTSFAYILIVSVYLLSDKIILFLYGKEFIEASQVLIIHVCSTIFVFLGIVSSKWIITENKTKIEFYRTLSGLIINIVLNLIFIKKYGIIGAAYASLITYIIAYYLFDIFRKDTRKMFQMKSKALLLIRKP